MAPAAWVYVDVDGCGAAARTALLRSSCSVPSGCADAPVYATHTAVIDRVEAA